MSQKAVFASAEDVLDKVGQPLGTSQWVTIEQDRINQFADATDDRQWIHVDPEKAKNGPFGAPIAHGYLTLSLISRMLPEIVDAQIKMGVNYGCDKIRFLSPVKVGSRIRGHGELVDAKAIEGGAQATIRVTVEIEAEDKPACVADTISRYYF